MESNMSRCLRFLLATILLLCTLWGHIASSERQITLHEYRCNISECKNDLEYRIIHVKSVILTNTTADTIHYIWAAIDSPVLIIAHGMNASSDLRIDWSAIMKRSDTNAIKFEPNVHSISAMTIGRIFEYVDSKDTVNPFQSGNTILNQTYDNFNWTLSNVDKDSNEVTFNASTSDAGINGTAEFKVKAYSSSGHRTNWPHETYNANSSEFTFTLKDLATNSKKSRFFVEVRFLTELQVKDLTFKTDKSLDDEYTPGIFKLWKLAIPTHHIPAFASWKPVAYTSASRNREKQTFAYNFPSGSSGVLKEVDQKIWSLADAIMSKPKVFGINVSFGMSSDDWYRTYKYISWTGLVGLGVPPNEEMSSLVITVIIVGLGIPAFFIIVGFGYVLIRRLKNGKRSTYDQIN